MSYNPDDKAHQTPKRLITHSEEFHSDDVFATALLLALYPGAEIVRSRDEAVLRTGDIVYDVGRVYDPSLGRYDHHQAQAGARENGIVYSSFGLLWKEYGVVYCDGNEEVARVIDQKLVMPIDANDNGQSITSSLYEEVFPFTIDDIIKIHNPLQWTDTNEEYDIQFRKAVALATNILDRLKRTVEDSLTSQKALLEAYEAAMDKRILVMQKIPDVKSVLERCPELLYIISQRPEKTEAFSQYPRAEARLRRDTLFRKTGAQRLVMNYRN